jgi:DNA repair protein RadC
MRPREKALVHGLGCLSNAELLAVLIGSGAPGEDALAAGQKLLLGFNGDLHALGRASICRFRSHRGIGSARAVRLAAAMELGRRRMEQPGTAGDRVTKAMDIVKRFRPRLLDRSEEEFWALALTRANTVIADLMVSVGGQSGTVVDPKVVFSKALTVRASALVLVHNHPSGNPRPSESDKRLTRDMQRAGKALDLPILDHVIIAGMHHFSFADHQLL